MISWSFKKHLNFLGFSTIYKGLFDVLKHSSPIPLQINNFEGKICKKNVHKYTKTY